MYVCMRTDTSVYNISGVGVGGSYSIGDIMQSKPSEFNAMYYTMT